MNNKYARERAENILACIGDGVITIDAKKCVNFINERAQELTEWTEEEALGHSIDEIMKLVYHKSEKIIDSPIDEVMKEKKIMGLPKNTVMISKNRNKYYLSASFSPLVYKETNIHKDVCGVVIVFRDITRIKRMEQLITRERSTLNNIFSDIPIGMLMLDKNTVIKKVNKNIEKMFGFSIEELVNRNFGDGLRCIFGKEEGCGNSKECNFCQVRRAISEVMRTEKTLKEKVIDKTFIINGVASPAWYKCSFVPINIHNERQILLAIEDVSSRVKYEQYLQKAKEDAEKVSEMKGRFVANISHEIKTPINGMVGMIDLVLMSAMRKEQRENLEIAKKCASNLMSIINSVLDFSKMEAGKFSLHNRTFSIQELLEPIQKVYGLEANKKEIGFKVINDTEHTSFLIGDPDRIAQVLNNLLANAMKFTDEGEVILEIKARPLDEKKVTIQFSIIDTGIGISDNDQKELFKSFGQLDTSLNKKNRGTGLGLAISKQLVELMGSKIHLKSEQYKGSVFYFTLILETGKMEHEEQEKINIDFLPIMNNKVKLNKIKKIPPTHISLELRQLLEKSEFEEIENQCPQIEKLLQQTIKDKLFKMKLLSRKEDREGILQIIKEVEQMFPKERKK